MAYIHLKTAWSHIIRSPFQALAAIFVLTITFFVVTLIAILLYSSENALKYFETRPQVIAFLKEEVEDDEISNLQKKLLEDSRISEVQYVTKDEALSIYKDATSDNPLLSELVSPSIFPASLEFSLADLSFANDVISEIQDEKIVDQVGFTATVGFGRDSISDVVERLRNVTTYTRVAGATFAVLLVGTSFFVLLIIISMRMTTRRDEIEILDLIGATPGFIRSPILIEATLYAFFGVLAGWAAALVLVLYATPSIITYFGDIPVLPSDTLTLIGVFGLLLLIELLIGFTLALTGGLIAVSRVQRRK